MAEIARALAGLGRTFPDCEIVVALHRNPIVRDTLTGALAGVERVHLVEPPDYVPFVKLMQRATLILTDSGGVQEEAPTLGVPILVLSMGAIVFLAALALFEPLLALMDTLSPYKGGL